MSETLTLESLKNRKKPVIRRAVICTDSEKAQEYQEALSKRAQLETMSAILPDDETQRQRLAEASALVERLKEEADGESVAFRFRSIGRVKYDQLLLEHPPTDQQVEDWVKGGGKASDVNYNPDTFPPALVAAASLEPKITHGQALDMWEDPDWNQAELSVLFLTALEANTVRMVVELGKE